jgi:hypothetical protein
MPRTIKAESTLAKMICFMDRCPACCAAGAMTAVVTAGEYSRSRIRIVASYKNRFITCTICIPALAHLEQMRVLTTNTVTSVSAGFRPHTGHTGNLTLPGAVAGRAEPAPALGLGPVREPRPGPALLVVVFVWPEEGPDPRE